MFSQTSEYALRAMLCLADANGRLTAPEIAEMSKVPRGYLAKILSELARAGLITSQRGIGGGFSMAKSASEISILDVINAVDPFRRITECPLKLAEHGTNLCALHRRLDDSLAHVEMVLGQSSLAEMLAKPSQDGCEFPLAAPSSSPAAAP